MKGGGSTAPFRVFGSPYTLLLHQHVTYLRLKQLPFKVYCTNFTTTYLYSLYYRARNGFCTLTPSGTSRLQVWQLAETAELDEDVEAIARSAKGDVTYGAAAQTSNASESADKAAGGSSANTTAAAGSPSPSLNSNAASSINSPVPRTQRLLISKATHPNLHLASWCFVVYACWWLAKTGAMYRYVRGDSLDVLEGYVRYFFIGGIGFARSMAPRFRQQMKQIVNATGASDVTAPYMDDHFMRLCAAMEAHLREQPADRFLLGTPHPTLADVTVGAAFSGFFLMDDPPSTTLAEKFPCVTEYAERVTGWRGSTFVDAPDAAAAPAHAAADPAKDFDETTARAGHTNFAAGDYADVVPETLAPCFELMAEVFPFLMSQCASFTAFMAGDGVRTLRREPLEGEWKGCEGYLLPQLTNVKSLMIVDDDVSTVQARSQDLEIAFLASREVHDDALHNFGRHDHDLDGGPPTRPTAPTAASTITTPEKVLRAKADTARLRASAAAAASEHGHATTTVETPAKEGDSVCAVDATSAVPAACSSSTSSPPPASTFAQPLDLNSLDPDDADFYRAYSAAGRRRLGGGASSLAGAMPSARHASVDTSAAAASELSTVPPSRAVAIPRNTVMTKLETLRSMLAKMSCPQYTLTSVFHGRRIYVAVIPEYEVAKVRQARRAAARSAQSDSGEVRSSS